MGISTSSIPKSRKGLISHDADSSLQDILKRVAGSPSPGVMHFYELAKTSSPASRVTYSQLYSEAQSLSTKLAALDNFKPGGPVLLHLEDHWDTILCFWAVVLAGGVPALSSPLSHVEEHRNKHLTALSGLLESPMCIARSSSLPLFETSSHTFCLYTIESLLDPASKLQSQTSIQNGSPRNGTSPSSTEGKDDTCSNAAVLMLTSGSTGNAKAVCLTDKQILAAISGKASVRTLPKNRAFLNWIGLDHVASLIEIHIQALWLNVEQVHVHAADVVSTPRLFLDLLSHHRVSRSFAPNFFLDKLVSTCGNVGDGKWDLSNLTVLASGGEANDVSTCTAASMLFSKHGASASVITPGFGMTETCAGSIFNLECPHYDTSRGLTVASLGHCMPGIEMRIVDTATGEPNLPGVPGDLQVRGEVVFKGYYRNPTATADAFPSGDWFHTGDRGLIDEQGCLRLMGRLKDVININGIKIPVPDVQAALETSLKDTCATRLVIFPSRMPGAASEQITVAYIPATWPPSDAEMAQLDWLAVQACMMVNSACRPWILALGPESMPLLPQTSLGKISGAKMRTLFEANAFGEEAMFHRQSVQQFKQLQGKASVNDTLSESETALRLDFAAIKDIEDPATIGIDTAIFDLGFTSMDVIRLKHRIDDRLKINVPTIVFMKNPTVRLLDETLKALMPASKSAADTAINGTNGINGTNRTDTSDRPTLQGITYDPIVTLCSRGSKTPLWLVHPGVGEVLVFVGLAKHIQSDDRPVYALRARGFEPGQAIYSSIDEAVDTYVAAIRSRQPHGPYALAGYSYGTMLAFEMAKRLEAGGAEVRFLGSFNLPPHIKTRMRQLNWNLCLLHLAQFLSLLDEDHPRQELLVGDGSSSSSYDGVSRSEALDYVVANSDDVRMKELGLGPVELTQWSNVAYGLQSMAVEYEPTGCVRSIDVFHAEPLKVAASSRHDWVTNHLDRWKDFCKTNPRFHAVGGAHYTMIGPEYVVEFSNTLKAALAARDL